MRRKIETYITGTAIPIFIILDSGPATSVTITIYNSSDVKNVDGVAMTEDSDRAWSYLWQTTDNTDASGTYKAIIEYVVGGYTYKEVQRFELIDEETPYI